MTQEAIASICRKRFGFFKSDHHHLLAHEQSRGPTLTFLFSRFDPTDYKGSQEVMGLRPARRDARVYCEFPWRPQGYNLEAVFGIREGTLTYEAEVTLHSPVRR